MLKNYDRGEWKTEYWFEIAYEREDGSGFVFPCDECGNPLPDMNPAALENLEWCRNHADEFAVAGEVVRRKHSYREPASGTCSCGNRVELYDMYMGACPCEKCGRWYNLFGQELLPPEQWEDDADEEYEEVW